ncbi:MAG: hypothetical protein U0791_24765 [Gemmataceae bacterium]
MTGVGRWGTAFGLAFVLGCGDSGPKTYPVNGTITLPSGDSSPLAGHNIEASLDGEPTVRASGVIEPNGRFKLETLQNGKVVTGAREGTYKVRLVLSDDDAASRKLARKAVPPRYFQFDTSGLAFQVPSEDVKLEVKTP